TANPTAYNANVRINTPITADAAGNVYFGYQVTNPAAVGGLRSGVARIAADGTGTFVPANTMVAGDASVQKVVHNCAPALSPDGSRVYVAVTTAGGTGTGNGYLIALDSTTLGTVGRADLRDVKTPNNRAGLSEN